MSTITTDQQQAISRLVSDMTLTEGLGDKENACSIAAINIALTGELTDDIPPCMSEVIGKWIIGVQDAMPSQMRNSSEWKRLLPLAAGTGRKREHKRQAIVMEWMWLDVLPTLQPLADRLGFGEEWRSMLERRTGSTAAACRSAAAAACRAAADCRSAAAIARRAAEAAEIAAEIAADKVAETADNVAEAIYAIRYIADAATAAANTAEAAARAADDVTATWQQFNPCGLLQRLILA